MSTLPTSNLRRSLLTIALPALLHAGLAASVTAQRPPDARRIVLSADSLVPDAPAAVAFVTAMAESGPRRAHARGGSRLAPILGDSSDHTLHNVTAVTALSGVTMVVLWALPPHMTKWTRSRRGVSDYLEAFTRPPEWDIDNWFFNYVGHPWLGMQTYLMERNWGRGPVRSFLFSTAASVGWEYLFEAWMEHPSTQDLLFTSPPGLLLGEATYQLTTRMRRNGLSTTEKVIVTIVNPLHVLQHGYR